MALAKIKKGDTVVVLAGKDKGKSGEVTAVMPKDSKVVVAGVNIAVRHRKASQANPQGGLDRFEAPLHISNVARGSENRQGNTRSRGNQGRQEGPRGREVRGDDQWLIPNILHV